MNYLLAFAAIVGPLVGWWSRGQFEEASRHIDAAMVRHPSGAHVCTVCGRTHGGDL